MSKCSTGLCIVDKTRSKTVFFFPDKSRCSSGLCGVDTSRCCRCPCGVDTSRCCRGLCSVDTSMCSSGLCGVGTSRSSTCSFCPYKSRCCSFFPRLSRSKGRRTDVSKNLQERSGTKVLDSKSEERRRKIPMIRFFFGSKRRKTIIFVPQLSKERKNKRM